MDPREKVLRDYFKNLVLHSESGGRVEKVNLFPNAEYLFLDMERVIQLGDLNKKYKDYYVSIDEFISRLLDGKFSVGSGMSAKLKDLHDKVEDISAELEEKSKMEEDIIEEDIDNLKELFVVKIEEYFDGLKDRLKRMFHEENSELKETVIGARNTLKEELLKVIKSSEFFDKNKFFVEFDELKKKPDELESFLKEYVNNEKTIQFNRSIDDNIKKLSPIFHPDYSLDDKISKYVLNVEKLESKTSLDVEDNSLIIDRFVEQSILQIDQSMKKMRHFNREREGDHTMNIIRSPGKESKDKDVSMSVSKAGSTQMKSPLASRVMKGTTGSKEKSRKQLADIPLIKFKNAEDLSYDYGKFTDCSITQVNLELHGNNLNQKSVELMGKFLQSVSRIERLYLNLSISSITRETLDPVSLGIRSLKSLKHLEIDLSRSKIETEAFELLCEVISQLDSLKSLTISIEK